MNVTELKLLLDKLIEDGKGNLEIVVSKDAEGNGFNEIDELGVSHCFENEPVHPDDIGEEYDEEDLIEKLIVWTY
jgi:hypothetical protein